MDNYFESILLEATLRSEGYFIDINRNGFSNIYPFTTENINGYIDLFNLKNKSLLTVGSSGDQAINAIIKGCKDITILDINPFTKFYFFLKYSSILTLNYSQFLDFFCYKDYPKFCYNNKEVFNYNTYKNIKTPLRSLDYESYLFWDELFSSYEGEEIRKNIFDHEEYRLKILKEINLYLKNEESYNQAKKEITKTIPNFITEDIHNINFKRNYDNIWLSNIGKYLKLNDLKKVIDKIYPHLNENGLILICYLYNITENTKPKKDWIDIYNLKKVLNKFKEYNLETINITGIKDIIFDDNTCNDMILSCKKKTKKIEQSIKD